MHKSFKNNYESNLSDSMRCLATLSVALLIWRGSSLMKLLALSDIVTLCVVAWSTLDKHARALSPAAWSTLVEHDEVVCGSNIVGAGVTDLEGSIITTFVVCSDVDGGGMIDSD